MAQKWESSDKNGSGSLRLSTFPQSQFEPSLQLFSCLLPLQSCMSCWEDEEGPPKGVKRARKQAKVLATGPQYSAGGDGDGEYNIWYHKKSNHGQKRQHRDPKVQAATRCCTTTDAGATKGADGCYHCVYFAQGRCALGYDCKRKHTMPTEEDDLRLGRFHRLLCFCCVL
jgi:hypothetical protein